MAAVIPEDRVGQIETLWEHLQSYASVTAALAAWCAARMAPAPGGVTARVLCDTAIDPVSYKGPLDPRGGESVRHRKVELLWGARVLSEAENWYLPDRLTPAMRASLQAGDRPFGTVVGPLKPKRITLAMDTRDDGGSTAESHVLHVRAVLITTESGPIAEVSEHYRRTLLLVDSASLP